MRIDSARFLALAAALATTNCTIVDQRTVADTAPGAVDSGVPAVLDADATPLDNTDALPIDSGNPDANVTADANVAADADSSTAEGSLDAGSTSEGGLDAGPLVADSGACLEMTPTEEGWFYSCAETGLPAECMPWCRGAAKTLTPKVIEVAVACMRDAVAATGSCNGYACQRAAMQRACSDTSELAMCEALSYSCGSVVEGGNDGCGHLMPGIHPNVRGAIASSCMEDCSSGLWSCIEGDLFVAGE